MCFVFNIPLNIQPEGKKKKKKRLPLGIMQLTFSQMYPIILQHTSSGASGGTKYKESFVATKWFANEMLQEYAHLPETLSTQIEKLFSYQSWEFLTLAVYCFNNHVHNVCKWTLFLLLNETHAKGFFFLQSAAQYTRGANTKEATRRGTACLFSF